MCGISSVAIWGEGGDGGGTYTRNRFDSTPPGFGGAREVWEFRLELRKMLFSGSPEDRYTLVPSFMEGTEITLSWVCFPWGKGKLIQDNCLATGFSKPWAGGRVGQLNTRGDKSVHEGEQISLKEFPGWVDVGESSDGRQYISLMAARWNCQSAWVKCQTRRHWGGSLITAREMSTLTNMWSEEPICKEEDQQIFSGEFVKIRSRIDGVPLVEIRVGKLTD